MVMTNDEYGDSAGCAGAFFDGMGWYNAELRINVVYLSSADLLSFRRGLR
jgi:hypothetical protein